MDTAALLEKKKDILKIAVKHGARNIRIFGSVARGEAKSVKKFCQRGTEAMLDRR
jgi:predicted nucleotidyltransferase